MKVTDDINVWRRFFNGDEKETGTLIEYHWIDRGKENQQCSAFLDTYDMTAFTKEIGDFYHDLWEQGGIDAHWQGKHIAVDFIPVCEYYELDPNEIFINDD